MEVDNQCEAAEPRMLILCFDGTAGHFDSHNTNVVKLFGLLRKDAMDKQRCYYQPGIGTYFEPGVVSPLFSWWAKILDDAIAWYLNEHVMDGYKFLMANYRPGDKICLFGFSRGAYTARALAGMLAKVGLLPRDNLQSVKFAYNYYRREDKQSIALAKKFKEKFCQEVDVEFVGVWDTVQSTGILVGRSLPLTDSNTFITTFRHALSLDEHRARFRPNLYHRPSKNQKSRAQKATSGVTRVFNLLRCKHGTSSEGNNPAENGISEPGPEQSASSETDVLEVWFAGCHCDIGGGNVKDEEPSSLAQITLRWMVEQVIASECGVLFEDEGLKELGITPRPVSGKVGKNGVEPVASAVKEGDVKEVTSTSDSPLGPSPPTSEAVPEFKDAIASSFDQLQINKAWWLLEIIPWFWQDRDGKWHERRSINLGRGRIIPQHHQPIFHPTVELRMNHAPLKYKPRATHNQRNLRLNTAT
ncbi:hypothetical protein M404DRAFT_495935 [Pisolithus tinctorius Marx 270]|uniref:T6SS Phospholipase effector Tle1-like catalytic domain-containing protein n=1 Tax=Pisolithus tinctorius Marx 270 TaxID=870435 RepID=A0A0C3PDD3_PISTI|nr:hypothetical protein M404DRAFT_495935 [Pisolithus tinctorius Marx 270]